MNMEKLNKTGKNLKNAGLFGDQDHRADCL